MAMTAITTSSSMSVKAHGFFGFVIPTRLFADEAGPETLRVVPVGLPEFIIRLSVLILNNEREFALWPKRVHRT
jgi:hypothetical protein